MKNKVRVLGLVLIMVMALSFSFAMADTDTEGAAEAATTAAANTETGSNPDSATYSTGAFQLLETYPADGAKETSMENMGVKLYFNKPMNQEAIGNANSDKFQLLDPDGKKLPTKVLYAPKEEGVVLVLLDTKSLTKEQAVQSNAEYSLKVSADVVNDAGETLGKASEIKFTTQNQSRNGLVNTLLMFVMMGGMLFFTMKGTKKKGEDSKEAKAKAQAPVNPYKEAKRTGKSIDEIIEKDKQRKEKQARMEAKEAEKEAKMLAEYGYVEEDYEVEEFVEENHYRVKKPRTVASAGSQYKTGRKAAYEAKMARAAQEAKWAEQAKKKKKKK